ncbi:MAG: hypothetical protein K0Q65_447 [Clostridia bacterium]|jgi:hypothetical protein|nr:hypothetical protein [Clostridia bacterium]
MAKKIEVDERVVKIQTHMDNMLEDINEIDKKKAELQALLETKVQALKDSFNQRVSTLDSKRGYLMAELIPLFEQVPQRVTNTMRKVSLLSGEVVIKNASKKIDYDKDKLLEYARLEAQKNTKKYIAAIKALEEARKKVDEIFIRKESNDLDTTTISDLEAAMIERETAQEGVNELKQHFNWNEYIKTKTTEDFDWARYKGILTISEDKIVNMETGETVEIEGLQVTEVPEDIQIKFS